MKLRLVGLLSIMVYFIACKKDGDGGSCISLEQHPGWSTILFKGGYSIQVPSSYAGNGAIGFEGLVFSKNSADNAVLLNYAYCSPLFCYPFGDTLSASIPSFLDVTVVDKKIRLDKKVSFCGSDGKTGVFYYNKTSSALGRLYWKDKGVYKEALDVRFTSDKYQEVLDILKSIKAV